MKIYNSIVTSAGNTPLIQLKKLCKTGKLLAKIEAFNPTASVKSRTSFAMVEYAERNGYLKDGMELLEPTSGNTGIALACIAAAKGIPLTITMPENMSDERKKLMRAYGAKLILTPAAEGMLGAVNRAYQLQKECPNRYYIPNQFSNPANPLIHRLSTGSEIWNDTDGKVDAVVAGIGTGGTISGIAAHIKQDRQKPIQVIGIEPAGSPVISQFQAGKALKAGKHKLQGLGAGFIPKTLNLELIDRVVQVGDEEAMEMRERVAFEEGILCGISSGAALVAAIKYLTEAPEAMVVVILPDSGERYLSII